MHLLCFIFSPLEVVISTIYCCSKVLVLSLTPYLIVSVWEP